MNPLHTTTLATLSFLALIWAPPAQALNGSSGLTARVSLDSAGIEGNDASGTGYPETISISADGRWVAFRSYATNLVPGDTNGEGDIFLHDRQLGTTIRVNVGPLGVQANGDSQHPIVSDDGRFVAFNSWADNLVPGDTNGANDVFLRDTLTGVTERVSVDSVEAQANGNSEIGDMTPDGNYITFSSSATNLVAGDTNGLLDVFIRERPTTRTRPISHHPFNGFGNGISGSSKITPDARYVAYSSSATNLAAGNDVNGMQDVMVYDRITLVTTRVSSWNPNVVWFGHSQTPSISDDGRYVTFHNDYANIVIGDTNGVSDCFHHDLVTQTTIRISVDSAGAEGNDASADACLSGDGAFIVFESDASNLVPGDTNGFPDVFVHELATGLTHAASADSAGVLSAGVSGNSTINVDGRFIAFTDSDELVPEDFNFSYDVYLRDCAVPAPLVYCPGKPSSEGCVPRIGFTGTPSYSGATHFDLDGTLVPAGNAGLLFYGTNGPQATPFQGGTMCVAAPRKRTPVQTAGGAATSCGGVFNYDMNALIAGGSNPALTLGQKVWCQWWFRDPASPSTTGLSSALEFTIQQ